MNPFGIRPDVMAAVSVVSFIVVICMLAKSIGTSPTEQDNNPKGRELLDQSIEWLRISEGTNVPLFAYRHTVFSLAYLNAARLVCPDSILQRNGTDVHKLSNRLETRLAHLSKKISKSCTKAAPTDAPPTNVTWI